MSMLEVLVSIVLVMLVVPFMAGLQMRSQKLNQRADQVEGALWAAQAKMEELRSLGYLNVADGTDSFVLPDGRELDRSWQVVTGSPSPGTCTVTVQVVRSGYAGAEPVGLSFVVAARP